MKKLILFSILALFVSRSYADDYYWVGGAGSWTDLTHWASTSGGAGNKSIVPGTGDDVYFDANSGLGANATVTMSTTGHSYCRNMSWTGVTTNAIFRNTGSFQMMVYGNMELSSTVRYDMRTITFSGNSSATFRMNGAVRFIVTGSQNNLIVNKPGGTLTLLDGIPLEFNTLNTTLTTGNLNMSGNTHATYHFTSNGTAARSLDISNATLNLGGTWDYRGNNGTLIATGSTINTATFYSDRYTFPKVNVSGGSSLSTSIAGTTFGELIFTNTTAVAPASAVRIVGNNTIDRLEFKGSGCLSAGGNVIGELIMSPGKSYLFLDNNTINTRFQLNSPDCAALGELTGANANAKLTFGNSAVIDVRNVYIKMLTAVGSMTPISVVGIDGDDNVGWTFQPRPSGTTLYWVGGAGDWNDAAHWSATSGGTGGACVPFTSDDVVFDANSGFTAGNNTVSFAANGWCHNITWTNVAASPVFNTSTSFQLEVWGSIVLAPTMTVSGNLMLRGTEASTITTNGCSNGTVTLTVNKANTSGGLTFLDNVSFPGLSVIHTKGSMSMANRTMNMYLFNSTSGVGRVIDISNATITVNYWNLGLTAVTWVNNAAGSFITANTAFTSNGLTYPKVYVTAGGNSANIANTTINELVFTHTASAGLIGLMGGNTIGTLEFKSNGELRGNNTITNLTLAPSKAYTFRNQQTINGLLSFNNPACNGLGEMRGGPGVLNFGPSSTLDFDNVYLQNMTATGNGVPVSVTGADAGGNTGFNITSGSGPRYWVGGSGDWSNAAHWSTTSGGPGGACVPTVNNDVFFDANSFTSGSSAVTITSGNAFCRNMDWTGAAFAPVFTKSSNALRLEIWGNLIQNPVVAINAQLIFTGATNGTLTNNGTTIGNTDFLILKPVGYSLRLMDNYSNAQTRLEVRYGGMDLSGRTVSMEAFSNGSTPDPTSLNITNANITVGAWEYQGAGKSLQASGSNVVCGTWFTIDGGTYSNINISTTSVANIVISNTAIAALTFTDPSTSASGRIVSNNTIGRLEFKGRGNIDGTGNIIDTLILSPGKVYTFANGSNTTITKEWFGSGTPCNLTEITAASTTATITKTSGNVEFDYVRVRGITAAGITPFNALEHTENLGNNTNWNIAPYNGSTPILGLGPDVTLCASGFPYTLNTNGFFASPLASYSWSDGSTGKTLVVNTPGTYSVTVSYPDGCSRTDNIEITLSAVTVDPITGTATVCTGATTTLSSTTTGGVWSTSNGAVATVSATGVVTGVTPGTANIIYTVTNGNGCSASQQLAVTVNATPVVSAITGTLTLFEGGTTSLSNTTPGGVWSSSNTAAATVDASGVVTGVAGGTSDITYSVTSNGCTASQTVTVTVDANSPAKRILSITKTADAAEPVTNGGFSISLPAGILATEDVTVTYTVSGTATAASDYTALSGTAVILAGQNSILVPVSVLNDAQIESTETVIVTLTAGSSTNYTYIIDGAAGNATVQITDDDDVPVNRLLSATAQLNANEPTNTGSFTIALPAGVLAPENITVTYTMSGTATNSVDYETLSGTAVIVAGQNNIVINVTSKDDQIIEGTENIILTITGGTTATAGNFAADPANGIATLVQNDDDYTTATRLIAVTGNANAGEPGTNSSFTISLPSGYTSALPITVSYAISGTASNGVDYNNIATTITLPANQNSIPVPLTVIDDAIIEQTETVKLDIVNGVAQQGATVVFTLSPDGVAGSATINITDDENIAGNKTLNVTAQNAAEPSTPGSFTFSLPSGVFASENITVNYTVSGTATAGSDYNALPGTAVIPAGGNNVQIALNLIDDHIIESTETVIVNINSGASTNFTYTPAPGSSSATADIADNDFVLNSNVVLLTKISDAVEGSTNGQYRVSFPPGITSSEDVEVNFSLAGTATDIIDYSLLGLSGGNIVIPAGANEVLIDVDASNDGMIEGPETVTLTLTGAASASHSYTIDPAGNGAVVSIVDANAANSTPLQVIAGTNAAESGTNATFTVKLAGGTTSARPITVGYTVSGTATSGIDYQAIGTITIPANTNSVPVNLNALDDKIIEPTEIVNFKIISGSATDGGGNAFIFPPDPVNENININIADNDATTANQVLKVVKTSDAAEPGTQGSYTISLPADYTPGADITLSYTMNGSAVNNTDYSISTITFPAYRNSIIIPLSVIDDKIIEGIETATLNLTGGTDANAFIYSADPASSTADLDITDDDNTAASRTLSVVATANATEGVAIPGSFTIKLPDGITAASAITVNYTIGGTATSGADYTALTGTATIAAGQNSVPVTVTAVNDLVIEQTEAVTLTITGGTGGGENYTPATGSETASVNIFDNDASVDANRTLRITRTTHGAEPATNGVFSIQLQANVGMTSSEDITVNYSIAGTATAGVDYTALSGSIVLPAGQNSVPLNVPVINDQLMESTETVIVTLVDANSASFNFPITATAGLRTATANIADDDNTSANRILTLTKIADAAEPGTNGSIRISLPPNVLCSVNINVSVARSGTATAGADYVGLPAVVIPAGKNYVDLPITVLDDNLIENTETAIFALTGTSTGGFPSPFVVNTTPVTVNITDDDNTPANRVIKVTLARDGEEGVAGTNGGVRFNFQLPLGVASSEITTINYSIGGTAVKGIDYDGLTPAHFSGTVTISAGQTGSATASITVDDQIIEGPETVTVTLTSASSSSFTYVLDPAASTATGQIIDNDNVPANLQLSVTKTADAAEPGTDGAFSVSLPAGITTTEDVTVNYTISGTATSGTDYATMSGSVVIPAGSTSVPVPVSVLPDQIIEGTETVILTITGGTSASYTFTPGTNDNATVNISDDDNTPANTTLSISKLNDASEPLTAGLVSIELPAGITASEDITVTYTISGTATADVDYAALSGSAIILAGRSNVRVPVPVIDDQVIEPLETVIFTLTGGNSTNFAYTGTANVTVNIADDDNTPANLVLNVTKDTDAAEPSMPGGFIIALPENVTATEDITVTYAISGTATASSDYNDLSGLVVIPAGNNSVPVPVTVVDDQVIEGTETVILEITGGSSASLNLLPGTDKTTSLDITDDDLDPSNLVLNISGDADGAEPGTNSSFTISLPAGFTSTEDITVNYTISGTAAAGSDYSTLSGSAVIPAGKNSVPVSVDVMNDDIIEPTETVIATLADGSSTNVAYTGTGSATVNIRDDESTVPANLELVVSKGSDAAEPSTDGHFVISLPGTMLSSQDVTVNYTISGTATAGTDYIALSGTAVIPAGRPNVSVPVTVQDDQVLEAVETVVLTLNGGTAPGVTFTGTGNATVNITDDENVPANLVLNVAGNGDAAEPGTNGRFTISLPNNITSSVDITANYTITGTATAGTDYIALSGFVVIPAGEKSIDVTVTPNDDQTIEGSETIVMTITGGAGTGLALTPGANSIATINLADDDNNLDIVVNTSTPTVAEPSTAGVFTISLAGGKTPATDVTVTYTISGTASAGNDYTTLSGSAVILAGESSVDVPLSVLDDILIEPTETVTITLTGGSATGLTYTIGAPNAATVNITDNDAGNLNLEVAASQPNAAEPATHGEFMISIADGKRTAEPLSIQYTISGSAVAGTDYQAITGTITIPAGENSIPVPVQVIDDILVEDPETVIMSITGGQSTSFNYTAGAANQATVTITSEDIPTGDLTITKEIVTPAAGPYRIGQEITYRITVSNIGNGLASGVVVNDTLALQLGLPTGTTPERGVVNITANRIVNWSIGDVTPGTTVQLEVRCRIIEGGALSAGVEVGSGSNDPDMTNNKAFLRLTIEGEDLSFPNVFSPNGDGKNEKFIIGGLEKYPGSKLQIFNRWGGQVYRSNDYRNDWNGSNLNEGTYYYILEANKPDGVKVIKGWILIVR